MSFFYTDVAVWGDSILFRGYKNGTRIQKKLTYRPTFYVLDQYNEYHDDHFEDIIRGHKLKPVYFTSIKEAKKFLATVEQNEDFPVYGQPNFQYSVIDELFPGEVDYDIDLIKVANLDIEVDSSNGFPDPKAASEEIISISCKVKGITYLFGLKPYTPKRETVKYILCEDEVHLLRTFVAWWRRQDPDVITGWYVNSFDIPYLINRMNKIGLETLARGLSPWRHVFHRPTFVAGQQRDFWNIVGVAILDYIDLYQKFTYSQQETYKLNHIAHVEVGEKKIDYSEYRSLHDLYQKDPEKFFDYNIRDTDLVDKIDAKMKLIELAYSIAYDAHVCFVDVFGTVRLWDTIIDNAAKKQGRMIQINRINYDSGQIDGAYVKEPLVGKHRWVVSGDVKSKYPTMIMQFNISPETIVDHPRYPISFDNILKGERPIIPNEDWCVAGNGYWFDQTRVGIIPTLIKKVFDDRNVYKDRYLLEETKLVAIEDELKKRGVKLDAS